MFPCRKETFFSSTKLRRTDSCFFFFFNIYMICQNVMFLAQNSKLGGGGGKRVLKLCIRSTEIIFKNRYLTPEEIFSLLFP